MSVSLTISNLDDETYARLQAEAQRQSADVESVAKTLLSQGLPPVGLDRPPTGKKYRDASSLAGSWTKQEGKEFLESIAPLRTIDQEIWQ